MSGFEYCIYTKIIHSSLLSWSDWYLKKLKDQIQNSQYRRTEEKSNHIYETYKNTFMPHECHIYSKAYNMSKATMCAYPQSDHALTHWEFGMQYCAKCQCVNLPYQEKNDQYSDTSPSIIFHIYHLISRCKTHGRFTFNEKNVASVNRILLQNNPQKNTLEKS